MTTWQESEAAKEKAIGDMLTPVQKILAEVMWASIPTPFCYGPIRDFGPSMAEFETQLSARGYVIVPREPTQSMIEAGAEGSGEDSESVATGAWKYMIAAAVQNV